MRNEVTVHWFAKLGPRPMGISGAYAARRRNPVFAAAWDAALSIAREPLADTLLARSMEGNVERIYRDGMLARTRVTANIGNIRGFAKASE